MKYPFVMLNYHVLVLRGDMFLPLIDFLESLIGEFQDLVIALSCFLHHFFLLNGHEVRGHIKHELSNFIVNPVFVKH